MKLDGDLIITLGSQDFETTKDGKPTGDKVKRIVSPKCKIFIKNEEKTYTQIGLVQSLELILDNTSTFPKISKISLPYSPKFTEDTQDKIKEIRQKIESIGIQVSEVLIK